MIFMRRNFLWLSTDKHREAEINRAIFTQEAFSVFYPSLNIKLLFFNPSTRFFVCLVMIIDFTSQTRSSAVCTVKVGHGQSCEV